MSKSTKLRKLIEEKELLTVTGAHDGLTAVIGEKAGFDALWASGLGISASYAVPDASILTMTEFLNSAINMNTASNLPVIADCDTGFGEVNNVVRMVKEYERNGIAAICIEDKQFPKRNSFLKGGQILADIDEFSAKIRAAKMAQETNDFMVIARLESFIAGNDLESAIYRGEAYVDAGADCILVHSKAKTPAEVFSFSKVWRERGHKTPLIVVPTTYFEVTTEELKNYFNVVIYANQALRASIFAMESVLSNIKNSGTIKFVEPSLTTVKEVFKLIGTDDLNRTDNWYEKTVKEYKTGLKEAVQLI